jgi:type VI secretion system secreted protein VgrG
MADYDQFPDLAQYKLSTDERPLRLVLDRQSDRNSDFLLPQRVIGKEEVCGGFEFRILCVSEDATRALKDFIGVPAELQVVTDRGALRRICGIVTEAASGQSDGGLATYQLVMRDALSVMDNRINTRVFREKNELDIIRTLVDEWRTTNPVFAACFDFFVAPGLRNRQLPQREFTMQHNESDGDFIRRLMQRRGIAWFFRPGLPTYGAPQGSHQEDAIGHTMVLFDDPYDLAQNAAGSVRFHRDAATEQRDAITGWSAVRKLQPGASSIHSWSDDPAGGFTTHSSTLAKQGARGTQLAAPLENYHVAAPNLGADRQDLRALTDAQMAHHECAAKSFHGEGGVRDLAVGEYFSLEGHPEISTHPDNEREFVLTAQHIAAQNNLPVKLGARVERLFERSGWSRGEFAVFAKDDDGEPLRYRTSFSCVRRGVRIVPPRPVLPRPQLQTAIVVGPEKEVVWCDRMGRVKVRFPATRPEDHAHASGAGSSDTDRDSAWVCVASSWAGNGHGASIQCGARLLPPVGTTVLIGFPGGDPDQPLIVGQLYNGDAPPPMFRQEDALPDTRYQSGMRSREVRGQRGNQLRLDDTTGQISAQLASDHALTELNLGYLTEPRQKNGANARGEGAELRTEEAIALHAARGILLSAWKLLGGAGAKGKQLAREDFLGLLRECGELCASLGTYAAEHNGLPIDTKEQNELLERFKNWEDGTNTAPKATEAGDPVIGVTSPAGIGFASSKAIISYSANNIDTTAQQHLQLTSGQRFVVNAGKGVSLFAHHDGMKLIAGSGKLLLQSQHDNTEINAANDIKLTATDGKLIGMAKEIVLVAEDGSFIKIGGGITLGTNANIAFKGANFPFTGPATMATDLPKFDSGNPDQKFVLKYGGSGLDGTVAPNRAFEILMSDGSTIKGISDAQGKTDILQREAMHIADIKILSGQ